MVRTKANRTKARAKGRARQSKDASSLRLSQGISGQPINRAVATTLSKHWQPSPQPPLHSSLRPDDSAEHSLRTVTTLCSAHMSPYSRSQLTTPYTLPHLKKAHLLAKIYRLPPVAKARTFHYNGLHIYASATVSNSRLKLPATRRQPLCSSLVRALLLT